MFSLYWRFGGWGVSGGGDATTRLSVIYADASGNLYIILADFHHIFLLDERSEWRSVTTMSCKIRC